eukprot:6188432-Pleurochrysis_carterae.AAC.5
MASRGILRSFKVFRQAEHQTRGCMNKVCYNGTVHRSAKFHNSNRFVHLHMDRGYGAALNERLRITGAPSLNLETGKRMGSAWAEAKIQTIAAETGAQHLFRPQCVCVHAIRDACAYNAMRTHTMREHALRGCVRMRWSDACLAAPRSDKHSDACVRTGC